VERQLTQAIGGITEPDARVMVRVAQEELRVNQLERSIDEDCSRILATRGPTASDLRLIITILKTITDLERIGDEGEKVAAIAARLALRERPNNRYREVRNLGEVVIDMVHDTLDAFARFDTKLALEVLRRDRTVDEEYEAIHRQNITFHDGGSALNSAGARRHVGGTIAGAHRGSRQEYLRVPDLPGAGQRRTPHQDRRDREGAASATGLKGANALCRR
jgi:phosphate transport system regulatory protein PhoU